MSNKFPSTSWVLLAGVLLMVVALLLVLPVLRLPAIEQRNLVLLMAVGIVYAIIANRAAARWSWERLAPVIQPLNILIVTIAFGVLYTNGNLVWTFYFVIPLNAALIVSARWAYLDGFLTAFAYLLVVGINGGLVTDPGQHMLVALVMIVFALFGGTLATAVRRQQLVTQATESKLQESEDRFGRMAEQAQDMIFRYRLTPTREFEYVNSAAHKITGFTSTEIYASPNLLFKRMHPEDRDEFQAIFRKHQIRQTPVICRWHHKDGRMLWLESHNVPIYDAAGKLIAIEGILRDITHTKQIADALQDKIDALQQVTASQEQLIAETRARTIQLSTLNEISRAVSTLQSLDNVFQFIYEQTQRVIPLDAFFVGLYDPATEQVNLPFLYDEGKSYQKSTFSLNPADLVGQAILNGKSALLNRTPAEMAASPEQLIGNTAKRSAALLYAPLVIGERIIGVISAQSYQFNAYTAEHLDLLIGIAHQAAIAIVNSSLHQAMQESEQRYRSLVENLPIAVYRVTPGPQGEFVLANPAYLKMFGYESLEELKHRHVSEMYMNPSERKEFSERVLRAGYVSDSEHNLRRKDGTPIWALINAQVVFQDGMPAYFDCTAIDITARKMDAFARNQAEQALQRRTEELETLLQTSNSISASLDLETVLTVIAEQARDLLRATEATLFLFDEKVNILRPIVALGEYTTERLSLTLRPGEGVVGWVAEQRLPAIINNAINDARVKHVPGTPEEDESILAAPLIHAERLQGVVMINRIPATGFKQTELDLLNGLAAQASSAIVNAHLFEETRRSAQEQRIISEIAHALNAQLDIHQAFPTVVRGLGMLVDCHRISLAMLSENHESFSMLLLDQPRAELAQGTQMPISATAAATDILAGRVHVTDDLRAEIQFPAEKILYDAGYRSRVNLPLIVGDRAIGALNLVSQRTFGFNSHHLPMLQQIADLVAIAVENMRLFRGEQTRRNELSALYELSRTLTNTTQVESIVDLVVRHAVQTVQITFARLLLKEKNQYVVRAAFPIRVLGRELELGKHLLNVDYPFCEQVLCEGKPVVIGKDDPRLNHAEQNALFLDIAETLYLIPLCVGDHGIGLLTLGEQRNPAREPLSPEKIRLANSIGDQAANALHRAELFNELENAYLQTVLALANAVDAKDSDTNVHSRRLAKFALAIGRELGLSPRALDDLHYGAILHDIGKIGVPDAILKKPAALEPAEWRQMFQHPLIGSQILAPLPRLAGAAAIVRHHHERYDGKGYPDQLVGEAIPLGARILTIVDSYGAMIDQRVYKEKRSHQEALAELERNAGTQFDPQLLNVFLRIVELERANEHND